MNVNRIFERTLFALVCIAGVTFLAALLILGAHLLGIHPNSIDSEEFIPVKASVVEKDHNPASTYLTTQRSGKVTLTRVHHKAAEYNVTIMYNGIEKTVDDENLFDVVEQGDTIDVFLCQGYNKDGELVKTTLTLTAE